MEEKKRKADGRGGERKRREEGKVKPLLNTNSGYGRDPEGWAGVSE